MLETGIEREACYGQAALMPEMQAGVYRFRSDADWGDIEIVLITNEFNVIRTTV